MSMNRLVCLVVTLPLILGAAQAAAADGPVEPVRVRAIVNFGFDEAALAPADASRLLAEVGQMKDVSWQSVTTVGHTDSVGPPGYNEALSARRAEAVKAYLVGQGLAASMIHTGAKAATMPVADNGSPAGRARNRRAEVEFQGVRSVAVR